MELEAQNRHPRRLSGHQLTLTAQPLATHDEVIDAEEFAVARDLLLNRNLVADDEPVAGEILAIRRSVIPQFPGGAFVFTPPAARYP